MRGKLAKRTSRTERDYVGSGDVPADLQYRSGAMSASKFSDGSY